MPFARIPRGLLLPRRPFLPVLLPGRPVAGPEIFCWAEKQAVMRFAVSPLPPPPALPPHPADPATSPCRRYRDSGRAAERGCAAHRAAVRALSPAGRPALSPAANGRTTAAPEPRTAPGDGGRAQAARGSPSGPRLAAALDC